MAGIQTVEQEQRTAAEEKKHPFFGVLLPVLPQRLNAALQVLRTQSRIHPLLQPLQGHLQGDLRFHLGLQGEQDVQDASDRSQYQPQPDGNGNGGKGLGHLFGGIDLLTAGMINNQTACDETGTGQNCGTGQDPVADAA